MGLLMFLGASLSVGQYVVDTIFHGESICNIGLISSIFIGGITGIITKEGANNLSGIIRNMMLSNSGQIAVKAITKAANRYALNEISFKGFQSTLNLFGKTAFNAIQSSINLTVCKLMISSTVKISISTIINGISSYYLSKYGAIFNL